MKNNRDIRNNFLKNKKSCTKQFSVGIVIVLMILTALPSSVSLMPSIQTPSQILIIQSSQSDPIIAVIPGPEVCDGVDNDGNGQVDEGFPDTDGDGTADCVDIETCDGVDNDGNGQVDEGFPNTDGDSAADCVDGCPDDPLKTEPGICGCGVPDTDSDGDGTPDCDDLCPYDPNKITPGACGCGVPDTDSDGDGIADCNDDEEPPTTILFYPEGGETLKGTVTVVWFVHDSQDEHWSDLPIYLHCYDDLDNLYKIFEGYKGPQYDHNFLGEFSWDTTTIPDGTYRLQLSAIDSHNNFGLTQSKPFQIHNYEAPPTNDPPNQPDRPSGGTSGNTGVEYKYISTTSDPDGDQIWFMFDWGDNTNSGWLGPYTNGNICEAKHIWNVKYNYNIKVKAKDIYGAESSWSDPLPITMPYSFNTPILQFLEWLCERFPHAFPMMRQLLGY